MLGACPRVRILVSSREPVGVAGEVVWQVRPLSVPGRNTPPDLKDLLEYEAVDLFVDRARGAQPDFALSLANCSAVADICIRLDGLPLSVEFAAARAATLSAQQISQRLDLRLLTNANRVAPPRHRTLETVLDWSHDLLSDQDRILFRRLAAFIGGFSLEAVEQVCADDVLATRAVLEALTRLVRASLVVADTHGPEARYSLLETTRAYATEQLERAGERAELHGRHLTFYLALAEEAEPHLTGPEQEAWLDKLQAEQHNLWAALERCCTYADAVNALRMAGALQFMWRLRGTFSEGIGWLQRSLELPGQGRPESAQKLSGRSVRSPYCEGTFRRACPRCRTVSHSRRLREIHLELRARLPGRGCSRASGAMLPARAPCCSRQVNLRRPHEMPGARQMRLEHLAGCRHCRADLLKRSGRWSKP